MDPKSPAASPRLPLPARSDIYAVASVADVDALDAQRALSSGLQAVPDPVTRARIDVAVRALGLRLPSSPPPRAA
jgi:hypothetical protein